MLQPPAGADGLGLNPPIGKGPPPSESRMERLAWFAGLKVDKLRELLRAEIAEARADAAEQWRAEQQRILAEAIAESQLEPEAGASDAPALAPVACPARGSLRVYSGAKGRPAE
jgi:hypothetical protein